MLDKKNIAIVCLLAALVAVFYTLVFSAKPALQTELVANKQQQVYRWKMVTSWPKGFPGLGTGPEIFAQQVNQMSGGRLQVKVYGAKEIVPALGVFDAVANGSVEMGHTGSYYWKGKIPASIFFTTIPFGMTANEMNAWLYQGDGLKLWQETYKSFGVIPLAGGNTGVQMAGWFNKEVNSLSDMQGLIMRIPGLAGEVFSRVGGQAVNIAGGDIYTSLKTGVIDAVEWVGPYNDLAMGFHEVAKYYYYPGWHEPGSNLELIVNEKAYNALPDDLKAIVNVAAKAANQAMLDEFTAKNNYALQALVNEHNVELRRFPDDVLKALAKETDAVLKDFITGDKQAQKVYRSYKAFQNDVEQYTDISERAYMNARYAVRNVRGEQ